MARRGARVGAACYWVSVGKFGKRCRCPGIRGFVRSERCR